MYVGDYFMFRFCYFIKYYLLVYFLICWKLGFSFLLSIFLFSVLIVSSKIVSFCCLLVVFDVVRKCFKFLIYFD